MVVPVATALPRDNIDCVDAVVILPPCKPALRMRYAGRRRADQSGREETQISCRRHLVVPSLTLHPLAMPFAEGYSERIFQNSQSVAASANKFGDPRLEQSRFRLAWLASREKNARRSGAEQPRGGVDKCMRRNRPRRANAGDLAAGSA